MLTTRRPVIPPNEAVAYAYIDGQFYFETNSLATHPVMIGQLLKAGLTDAQIKEGVFGYILNNSYDETPDYENEQYSDFFHKEVSSEVQADIDAKLQAWFPGIKNGAGRYGKTAGFYTMHKVPTESIEEHPDWNNGRIPWIADPETNLIYYGEPGHHHPAVVKASPLAEKGPTMLLKKRMTFGFTDPHGNESNPDEPAGHYFFKEPDEYDPDIVDALRANWDLPAYHLFPARHPHDFPEGESAYRGFFERVAGGRVDQYRWVLIDGKFAMSNDIWDSHGDLIHGLLYGEPDDDDEFDDNVVDWRKHDVSVGWYEADTGEVYVGYGNATPQQIKRRINQTLRNSGWTVINKSANISGMEAIDSAIQSDPAAKTAISALTAAGGRVFVVGGAVRDAVLGARPKDIDLMCQGLDGDQIVAALQPLGRLDFTGKQFGVFRFKSNNSEVEIALPRTERSTGLGHKDFEVTTDHTLDPEDDLARRDFTGNAMAYEPATGTVIDPHGGVDDLQSGTLSLVNDKAFEDDPLRIVRALVANARFGLEPDDNLKQALADNAERIRHLPGERIQMELDKLLSSADPAKAVELAEESGLIPYLFPELDAAVGFDQMNPHHDLDVFQHTMQVLRAMTNLSSDPDLRLAALFHDSGKPDSFWRDETAPAGGGGHFYKKVLKDGTVLGADHEDVGAERVREFMTRLRYPNARIERVTTLVQNHMFPYFNSLKGARKFLRALNGDVKMAFDLLTLREADASGKSDNTPSTFDRNSIDKARALLQEAVDNQDEQGFTLKDLAVNGRDMMQIGLKGPAIGQALNRLLDLVIDHPELNDHSTLMQLATETA